MAGLQEHHGRSRQPRPMRLPSPTHQGLRNIPGAPLGINQEKCRVLLGTSETESFRGLRDICCFPTGPGNTTTQLALPFSLRRFRIRRGPKPVAVAYSAGSNNTMETNRIPFEKLQCIRTSISSPRTGTAVVRRGLEAFLPFPCGGPFQRHKRQQRSGLAENEQGPKPRLPEMVNIGQLVHLHHPTSTGQADRHGRIPLSATRYGAH